MTFLHQIRQGLKVLCIVQQAVFLLICHRAGRARGIRKLDLLTTQTDQLNTKKSRCASVVAACQQYEHVAELAHTSSPGAAHDLLPALVFTRADERDLVNNRNHSTLAQPRKRSHVDGAEERAQEKRYNRSKQ